MIDKEVDEIIKGTCLEIEKRYETQFLEIGTDKDHVHFLIQSIPRYSPTRIIQMIKSLTAREVFRKAPKVRQRLWGGEFWSVGYFVSTVGQKGSEDTIQKYVKEQGKEEEYQQLMDSNSSYLMNARWLGDTRSLLRGGFILKVDLGDSNY